jgi:crotonobetainyl-CoA:carnitine CoA-transferase CaiB-like acyl-CoA transferase
LPKLFSGERSHPEFPLSGPLEGIVVVDLSRAIAGPHAAMMLGDMGARVIKVEHPQGGDDSRSWGPFVGREGSESSYFMAANRNKESIVADLKSVDGRNLLTRLVRHADVIVENFRPGVLDRLGFSTERLTEMHPKLVVLSITGFGLGGPYGDRPGYDLIMQVEAGLMSVTGSSADEPTRIGVPICDVSAGIHGAFGVVAALFERERTGRGRVVTTSLLAAAIGMHAFQATRWTVAHEVPRADGNHHPSIAPYGAFRCRDGAILVAVGSHGLWLDFARAVGLDPDDARYRTNTQRVANRHELIADVQACLAGASADVWVDTLSAAGIPVGRIRTIDEVYEWEQTRSQGLVIEVDHPVVGPMELPGPAVRLGGASFNEHRPPPLLGQHTVEVEAWLDAQDRGTVEEAS